MNQQSSVEDRLPVDVLQRIECTNLRMRLEEIGDALVQEMFELPERPWTRDVGGRITSLIGRIPGELSGQHWETIAGARNAYEQLCNVIHGRSAWTRIPATQLATWKAAVERFEELASAVGLSADT